MKRVPWEHYHNNHWFSLWVARVLWTHDHFGLDSLLFWAYYILEELMG
ncbi:hypothetical protein HanXRQr2_Chr03g0127561 [Helianthus annuus]|uniref:Uncharacterized protein n=1 Tax=Helianthus annuus TaxID=4232 RepID=A0A9K3JIH0_HELAN|nr:hypothetical protein HanXRQr2_Chr03g0127561 [Helianthus annuus]